MLMLTAGRTRAALLPRRHSAPQQWTATRHYDRRVFAKQKKAERDAATQANVRLADATAALRRYAMSAHAVPLTARLLCAQSDRPVRGDLRLPHAPPDAAAASLPSSATSDILLVFAHDGPLADQAKLLGANIVGGEELIEKIEKNEISFDRCLATKAMFPVVLKVAKILGPKGLMPSPGRGTVSDDIAGMIAAFKSVKKYSADEQSIVSVDICEIGWPDQKIYGKATNA
ncbi:hypothetical protein HK100_009494 [Physocladia obscura]|uniref:Ribosomal protein n=1 Tax=Physocladia obscura TaxID=109957 RepID=A0AAD5SLW2_9FUNG|nr:hypothetical protein HK100_009494 [Physocladia obscura]